MSGSSAADAARTPFQSFLAALGREPSAAECEQWAADHAGGPEEPRALVQAGWSAARDGETERGLELFRRAAGFGGEFARDAQVGIVEQLYELGRDEEADAAQRALRAELDDRPAGIADLRVFDDMTQLLTDARKSELALEWCEAGLERVARSGAGPEADECRGGLLVSRAFLRQDLGIELDDEDREVLAEDEARFETLSHLVGKLTGRPTVGDRAAFDGVVLRWVRADFPEVRVRWPEETIHYGDDYDSYAARIQREARAYAESGAARVLLVNATLTDYEAYAQRENRDPADQSTRQDYGQWCVTARPRQVQSWPPGRNDACWCDSGRKYKRCCGAPAKD